MILVASTQVLENYGFGLGGPHWKPKGGDTYVLARLSVADAAQMAQSGSLSTLVEKLVAQYQIAKCNDLIEEYLIDWSLEDEAEFMADPEMQEMVIDLTKETVQ